MLSLTTSQRDNQLPSPLKPGLCAARPVASLGLCYSASPGQIGDRRGHDVQRLVMQVIFLHFPDENNANLACKAEHLQEVLIHNGMSFFHYLRD